MKRKKLQANFPDAYRAMYESENIRSVTFIVTHECNLRCSYCYEHNKTNKNMSFEMAKKCVDMLFCEDIRGSEYINSYDAHGVLLDFIGGEPLLEIGLIDRVVDYFRSRALALGHRWAKQYMVSMSTNGTLYQDERVEQFLAKNEGRVSMSVTLDGDRETHDRCRVDCRGCGSYDKAAAAFRDIAKNHGQKGTKFTVAPGNVDRVYVACRDMIERFDLDELHCNCVFEEGWNDELAGVFYFELKHLIDWLTDDNLYDKVHMTIFDDYIGQALPEIETQNWCGGTGKMLAFDIDGTVYPCLRYAPMAMSGRPLLRIGDVEHGIGFLKKDKETVDMLNAITRQSQSTEECLNCPIASGCAWCSAYNYEATGSVNKRVTFICPTHKARVMAASYYWNKIYRLRGETERFALNIPRDWAVAIIDTDEYEMLKELAQNEMKSEV